MQHSDLVLRLKKPGDLILSQMSPAKADLEHMAIGVAGEASELLDAISVSYSGQEFDRENLVEEFGDLEFFLEGTRQRLGIEREVASSVVAPPYFPFGVAGFLSIAAGRLLDAVKRWTIYNKPLDLDDVKLQLASIEAYMEILRQSLGITREETLEHNIAKLSVRYSKMSYSDQQAQDRADKRGED
jgi:NTP pyrophosphatase (non-canonical NTP hydrolase)